MPMGGLSQPEWSPCTAVLTEIINGSDLVLDDVCPRGNCDLDELHLADPLGVLLEQPLEGAHPRHQALRVVQPVHSENSLESKHSPNCIKIYKPCLYEYQPGNIR